MFQARINIDADRMIPKLTPIPMPALAPLERPDGEGVYVGIGLDDEGVGDTLAVAVAAVSNEAVGMLLVLVELASLLVVDVVKEVGDV